MHEIIGIARDVKFLGLDTHVTAAYYRPSKQYPLRQMTVLARTEIDPRTLIAAARDAVSAIDPDLPVANASTMAQHFDHEVERRTTTGSAGRSPRYVEGPSAKLTDDRRPVRSRPRHPAVTRRSSRRRS